MATNKYALAYISLILILLEGILDMVAFMVFLFVLLDLLDL